MNDQVNYAKIQRIQDNLEALTIGQFGTGFVTDAMLYESGIKATVAQHSTDLADIVPKTYVTYSQFGAVLDGFTDDTIAIKACHDYANANKRDVVQKSGIIYITDTVTVKTNTDISGCTLMMNEINKDKILYQILPTVDFNLLSSGSVTQAQLTKGTDKVDFMASKPNNLFWIRSDELIGYRGGNVSLPFYKEEMVTHIRDGILSSGEMLEDFTSSATLNIYYRPIENKPLIFKCPTIDYQITDISKTCTLIYSTRDNVTISDCNLVIANENLVMGNTSFKGNIIRIEKCFNNKIERIIGSNITGGTTYSSGYLIDATFVNRLTIDSCNIDSTGWGCMGTHYIKDFTITNSTLNRIDCHYGLYNMYVNNCVLHHTGIVISDGGGTVTIENSTIIYTDYRTYQNFIIFRTDLGRIFQGVVYCKNLTLINKSSESPDIISIWLPTTATTNTDIVQIPDIDLQDIRVVSNTPVYILQINNSQTDIKDVYLPKLFTAINIKNTNESDTRSIYGINFFNTNNKIKTSGFSRFVLERINSTYFSKMFSTYSSAEIVNGAYYSNLSRRKTLVLFDNGNNVNTMNIEVKIRNSYGSVYNKNIWTNFDIFNSYIHCLMSGSNSTTQANAIRIKDSYIVGYPSTDGTKTEVLTSRTIATDNIYIPLIVDSVESIVELIGESAKLLKDNYVQGSSSIQTITVASALLNTVASTIFRLTT